LDTVFLFHGTGGNSRENWFPWLSTELRQRNFLPVVPDFPHPDQPVLAEWLDSFSRYADSVDERTIFVGHSLGGTFALRLLEQQQFPIRACLLVASVWDIMGNAFDAIVQTFTRDPYHWETLRKRAGHFSVLHSENDPYIRLSQAEELARHLGVDVTLIRGGGHLNAQAGFTQFPLLLEQITALR